MRRLKAELKENFGISIPLVLSNRIREHCLTNNEGENISDFAERALINQLEAEDDWTIRDTLEEVYSNLED